MRGIRNAHLKGVGTTKKSLFMGLAITKYGVRFFRNGVEIAVIALEIKMLSYLRIYKHLYINDLKYFLKNIPEVL